MSVPFTALTGKWSLGDYLGQIRTLLGIRRNQYKMEPGLYSLGNPRNDSPVLVTANYKLTVNVLRRAVRAIDLWILVLDTKGVNVWCAAGKGTFGTDELVRRIQQTELSRYISHKKIIVPQLGAPGINPLMVRERTEFTVIYGPVEACDVSEFIRSGLKADEKMRRKEFRLKERLAVSVTHFSQGLKWAIALAVAFIIIDAVFRKSELIPSHSLISNFTITLVSLFTGSIAVNGLLPYLPGRSFSIKGLSAGLIFSVLALLFLYRGFGGSSIMYSSGKVLLLLTFIVYQALNLTGSSTYTSLAGVQKEMGVTVPALIISLICSVILIILGGMI